MRGILIRFLLEGGGFWYNAWMEWREDLAVASSWLDASGVLVKPAE